VILLPEQLSPAGWQAVFAEAVAPRPLAIVSLPGPDLHVVEWYSTACAYPPVQYFSVGPWDERGEELLASIWEAGDFVLNGVDEPLAGRLPALAGVTREPSVSVRSPRIRESPAQMECRLLDVIPCGDGRLVAGEVLAFHVRDDLYHDDRIDARAYRAVGRVGSGGSCTTAEPYVMEPREVTRR
jgi:flavin reductase (DIM6/NTAB) family NADH-FMN oxidoreductase RutF